MAGPNSKPANCWPGGRLIKVRVTGRGGDGLIFQTKTKTGYPAIILTDYTSCGVPTSDTLRIAQVTDSLGILGYLQTYVKFNKNPWSKAAQYVAAVLPHFSNYAVAW